MVNKNGSKKIYWLTGLPCSGKSSIAKELSKHIYAEILDGDIIRNMTNNSDFSDKDRTRHMMYTAAMAHYISKHQEVIVSLVSPLRSIREMIKSRYDNIREIYVKCPPEICKKRDIKGMYAKAIRGEITNFTGVQKKYEEPLNPDLIVETNKDSLDECVNKILRLSKENNPKALLIGRWQPLHEGHKWLVGQVQEKGHEVLIGIRNTPINNENPYSVQERIGMIQEMFGDSVDYLVLPDIVGVYYGRGVGYEVKELTPPRDIGEINATKIRRQNDKF